MGKDSRLNTPEPWKPTGWGLLSFGWADKPVGMARRQEPISTKDLYLPKQQTAEECYKDFEKEFAKMRKSGKSRPLLRTLFSLYGSRFFVGGLFKIIWSIFVIVGAFYFVRSCAFSLLLLGSYCLYDCAGRRTCSAACLMHQHLFQSYLAEHRL